MSQMNTTSQNLPNGLPPQAMSINKPNAMPPEKPLQYQHPFNGIGSSHSSRDSSPSSFLRNIPSSQLPPTVSNIPATQLPPVRHSVNANQLAQNYSQLRISTPASSPKPSGFNTSTPNEQYGSGSVSNTQKPIQTSTANFSPKSSFSPITSNVQSSVTNNYSNVALNAGSNTQVDGSRSIESNKYTANISNKPTEQTLQPPNVSLSSHFADVQKQTFTQPVLPPQQMVQSVNVQNVGKISQVPKMPVTNTFQQGHHQTLPTNLANYPSQGNASQGSSEKSIQSSSYLQSGQTVQQPFQVPTQINPKQNHAGYGPPLNVSQNQILPPNASVYNNSSMPQNTARPDFANRNPPVNGPPLSSNMTNNASSIAQPNLYSSPSYSQPPANVPYNFHQQNIPNSVAQLNPNQTTRPSMYPKKYPQQQQQQQYSNNNVSLPPPPPTHLNQQQGMFQNQSQYSNQAKPSPYRQNFEPPNVTQSGFNKLWNQENYDLLQCPNILPTTKIQPTKVSLGQEFLDAANCSPEIFRCTMTKIPETSTLLQKSRLPLGVLIHPFKDLNHLPVIQCNVIVRCRACRTYINPFVFFVDSKRWKCNLCYRINDLPEEFQYDPVSKTYGDPSRRPEIRSSTIEYIAPAEYMLRPPQPAVYLFLLDISQVAVECGYLHTFCNVLAAELTKLPGDARTQVGFMAYDSALHFFSLGEGLNQPHEMIVLDIDEVFLPCPDNLLVNLKDRMELVQDLLTQLPTRYENSYDNGSALGAALQAAHKLMAATGGRVTVFQATLPTIAPGALLHREDPNNRASSEAPHLNPANDFYKRLALECSGQQIAVDLFIVNSQYVDIATISGISRFSGGCIHHFPLFKASRTLQSENLERCFRRYLTRKIGFEAVMRIRCTRGLSIHTFHGNFFVRSTDLLSLPNVNPDAGFGMQVSIDESLSDVQSVCFQAALLYTSSKGERRIRVHTLCLPVVSTLNDVIHSADQQCIVGLLAKMAVDRSMQSSLSDAREAFINVAIDILSSYKLSLNLGSGMSGLLAPNCLKLLPLYICALLKHVAFRTGTSTRLDDRVKAMCDMKTRPLSQLIQNIYPDLYPVHNLDEHRVVLGEDDEPIPQPPHLQLTARSLEAKGAFLMDMGEHMVIFVCSSVSTEFLNNALNVPNYASIPDEMCELPQLENTYNRRLHSFINYLNEDKPFVASLQIMKENSVNRSVFFERLIEDRIENALSYHEFLQHIKTQVK